MQIVSRRPSVFPVHEAHERTFSISLPLCSDGLEAPRIKSGLLPSLQKLEEARKADVQEGASLLRSLLAQGSACRASSLPMCSVEMLSGLAPSLLKLEAACKAGAQEGASSFRSLLAQWSARRTNKVVDCLPMRSTNKD